jgi:hypothetical protein
MTMLLALGDEGTQKVIGVRISKVKTQVLGVLSRFRCSKILLCHFEMVFEEEGAGRIQCWKSLKVLFQRLVGTFLRHYSVHLAVYRARRVSEL